MVVQVLCNGAYQRGRDQRFIALHIDHDGLVRPIALLDNFRDAIGAAGVGLFGQTGLEAVFMHSIGDRMVVGCDPDLLRAALRRLLRNPDHHRFTGDRQQRFAVQPGRRMACRDDNMECEHQSRSTSSALSLRASSASITGMSSSIL
jgi:hypothetical protein